MGAAVVPAITAIIGATSGAITWAVAITTILVNVGLALVQTRLAKRGRKDDTPPQNVTVRTSVEPRRLVLGERRVGGALVFYGTSASVAGGTAGDWLWYVIVYAGHQVDAITHVYLDTEKVDNSLIPGAGGVVATGKYKDKLAVWKYLGTQAQTADPSVDAAFGAQWTANHRLRGCAYVVVRMTRDDTAFPSGAPQSVSAQVRGAKLYDPRQDSTNGGSGAQRMTDPQTWVFSRNPALVLRWYLTGGSVVNDQATRMIRYGLRETDARISDPHTIAAANVCNETLSGANAPPPGGNTNRYRCDIEASCGEPRRDIIEAILASMGGTLVNVHGKWRMYAGAYNVPLHSINENDLYEKFQVRDTASHEERYNAVCAVYCDAGVGYIDQTTVFRTDAAYETQDGGERINEEIRLRAVTEPYQAQRLAEVHLRKSRMMRQVTLVGALNLLRVSLNEGMLLSHARMGWNSRVFRCISRELAFTENAGQVTLSAMRDDAGVWTDLLTADYTTGKSSTDVYTADGPTAPLNFLIQPHRDGILFAWTFPGKNVTTQLFEHTAANPFSAATLVWEGDASSIVLKRFDFVTRYYWIRHRVPNGSVSATVPAGDGSPAATKALNGWVPRGNVHIDDNSAVYTGPGDAGAWGGLWGGYTIESGLVCSLKAVPIVGNHAFLGLDEDPANAADYPHIAYGLHMHSTNVSIYENGTAVATNIAQYNSSSELAIIYDGSWVRYYLDRNMLRQVPDNAKRFYGLVAFFRNDVGSRFTNLRFAPVPNLDYITTPHMYPSVATDVFTTTVASANILGVSGGAPGIIVASLTIPAYTVATQQVVTAAGTVIMNAPSQVFSACAVIRDFNNGVATVSDNNTIARNPSTSLPEARASYARELWYSVAANTAKTYYLWALAGPPTLGGSSASLLDTTFKVEVIKR